MAVVRLDNQMLHALKNAFMLFDYDKDGRIYKEDIGPVIRAIGLKPTQEEVRDITRTAEDSYNGQVDLQTLVQLISSKVTNPPQQKPDDLMEMFRMYDKDNQGSIKVSEMRHLLTSIGEKLTDDEADNLLKMSGCVSGSQVDYKKFVRLVMQG